MFPSTNTGESVLLDLTPDGVQLDGLNYDLDVSPATQTVHGSLLSPHILPHHGRPSRDNLAKIAFSSSPSESSTKPARRKPIPRKGHTKSRRGCFNCKRRKIKCQETLPECSHCEKAGLVCEYPETPARLAMLRRQDTRKADCSQMEGTMKLASRSPSAVEDVWSPPLARTAMSGTPGVFSMQDMRLFHNFLTEGYPHLPIGADKIWVTTLPAIAHEYEYLMHGMLALSASSLDVLVGHREDFSQIALSHRLKAISALNSAIAEPARSRVEADSRMAAVLVLTFQAVYLEDNYAEYLTLQRGCFLLGADQWLDDARSIMTGFRNNSSREVMMNRLAAVTTSPCNPSVLDEAVAAVARLEEVCSEEYELEYIRQMQTTLRWAYTSPQDAYASFTEAFSYPATLSPAHFHALINPANASGQLLLAVWLGIQHAFIPILVHEFLHLDSTRSQVPTRMNSWLGVIAQRLGPRWERYWEWPVEVVKRPFHAIFAPEALREFGRAWAARGHGGRARVVRVEDEGVRRGARELLGELDGAGVRRGLEEEIS